MRGEGINYDTGFFHDGTSTREPFDPETVKREMRVIHDDLHCTAVRITGGDADRLEIAAEHAAGAGLEVWLSPFTCDLTQDQLLDFLADCAERAERLRRRGAEIVFLTGSEVSMFTRGFLPGDTLEARLELLADPPRLREAVQQVPRRLNDFLAKAVAAVRDPFAGKISYASLPFEGVDWTPFDIIATDAGYRAIEFVDSYRDNIRALVAQGKPVAITEFGCATHRGAAGNAGRGDRIVEWARTGTPLRLTGEYVRDEQEQAGHIREILDILTTEGVDSAFVYTFARYDLPHRPDPREDFDLASYGVVKVLDHPDRPWEPKAAFATLADYYGTLQPARQS